MTAKRIRYAEVDAVASHLSEEQQRPEIAKRLREARDRADEGRRTFLFRAKPEEIEPLRRALRATRRRRHVAGVLGFAAVAGVLLPLAQIVFPPSDSLRERAKTDLVRLDGYNADLSHTLEGLKASSDGTQARDWASATTRLLRTVAPRLSKLEPDGKDDREFRRELLEALAAERTYLATVRAFLRESPSRRQQVAFVRHSDALKRELNDLGLEDVNGDAVHGANVLSAWYGRRSGDDTAIKRFPRRERRAARDQVRSTPSDEPDPREPTRGLDDADGDDVPDAVDNCPGTPNRNQGDGDVDGRGDACDRRNDVDADGDGVADALDNCLKDANRDQADADLDGRGDECDRIDDRDQDGDDVDDVLDNCKGKPNGDQADADLDGLGDACDATDDRGQDCARLGADCRSGPAVKP